MNISVLTDPSHLWWQGIDPIAAIRILGQANAIHHFMLKIRILIKKNVNMYGLTICNHMVTLRQEHGHSVQLVMDMNPYVWAIS